jgi:hypothetical protein
MLRRVVWRMGTVFRSEGGSSWLLRNVEAVYLPRQGRFHGESNLERHCIQFNLSLESYVTTDGQPACLSWNKAPIWGLRPDFYYCLTVAGLLIWGALSNERTGLPFTIAAGPRQRSNFRVRVP